jgi:hypothetical protein
VLTAEGAAIQCGRDSAWDFVPVTWRWLLFEHEQELAVPRSIAFMAPTAADCWP